MVFLANYLANLIRAALFRLGDCFVHPLLPASGQQKIRGGQRRYGNCVTGWRGWWHGQRGPEHITERRRQAGQCVDVGERHESRVIRAPWRVTIDASSLLQRF
jgi:hypothetical protein